MSLQIKAAQLSKRAITVISLALCYNLLSKPDLDNENIQQPDSEPFAT